MHKIVPKLSYRFDALTLTIINVTDVVKSLVERGFIVRNICDTDNVRAAKGYKIQDAKMLVIPESMMKEQRENNGDEYAITLQLRGSVVQIFGDDEQTFFNNGLLALSGANFEYVDVRKMLKALSGISKATRFDIVTDMTFDAVDESKVNELQNKLCTLVGFSPSYMEGNEQNPVNAITGGRLNKNKPIKKATKTISNGLTLYVGGRSSKFMIRCYNKSAEVAQRTGEELEPTLRIELEVKQENAEAVRKYILKTSDSNFNLVAKKAWHTMSNDNITFNDESLASVLGLGKAKEIQLDYSKIEGETLEYDFWVRQSVAPKFKRLYGKLSADERLEKLKELFGVWEGID